MIPKKFAPVLFGLFLSGLMSLIVSGISTLRTAGSLPGFFGIWAGAWLASWLVAFPSALLVAPLVNRLVRRLTWPR